jgi:hypothetical protein
MLNNHTSYTITGKPFPLSVLGPAPRPNETERVATVQTVMANNTRGNPVIGMVCSCLPLNLASHLPLGSRGAGGGGGIRAC